MSARDEEPFYIGYLPQAPEALARFTRRAVLAIAVGAAAVALGAAVALPYFGDGTFAFGRAAEFSGTMRCDGAPPRLAGRDADYLLVGYGKRGVPLEICGATGQDVVLRGSLIEREGRRLLEIVNLRASGGAVGARAPVEAPVPLGRFTLTGEIVDSKCYFGVMNPAQGRLHRACAELCLRGGVPAVFVVRDRAGRVAHLLFADEGGRPVGERLIPWVGEAVELSGKVSRRGRWLVIEAELGSVRRAKG